MPGKLGDMERSPRTGTLSRYALFCILLAFLAAFLIWPVAITVSGAFTDPDGVITGKYFFDKDIGVLRDPVHLEGLANSLRIAVYTTIVCLALSLPLALLAARYEFRGKTILTSLILVPLILPPFVGAIGMRAMLGRFGALNSLLVRMGILGSDDSGIDFLGGEAGGRLLGVVLMEALHLYPIMYLNVTAALANLDPALDEAAKGLGASPIRRFLKITTPLIMPGVFAGVTIVFIWSFTELGTPLMFDYYTVTPVQIFWGIQQVQSSPRPYALVVMMLLVALGLYTLGRFAFGSRGYAMQSKAAIASRPVRLGGLWGVGATLLFVMVTAVAVLPHAGVVISSFSSDGGWYRSILPTQWTMEHYDHALGHPLAMGAISNSLFYAGTAVVLTLVIGLAISYLNVRVRIRGGWLLDSLAMLPLAVPGLVIAFGYLGMTMHAPFTSWPFSGAAPSGIARLFTWLPEAWRLWLADGPLNISVLGSDPNPVPLLIIAYTIRRLPYVVRSVSAGLEQTSGELEEAAHNLGASTFTAIRRIIVPLIMANIIAGAILAFSFSMLEVSDSLILAQKQDHYPITKAIWELFSRLGDGPYIASAMGVWGMALLTITLVGAGILLGKKLGAIFRM